MTKNNHPMVIVQAMDGQNLNPCHPSMARKLLKKQKAIMVSKEPFIIRMTVPHTLAPKSSN